MNKHRSPLSGANTSYFIGIILGIMFPILPFIIYNNSKVETVNEQQTTTETTAEFITTEEIVIEEITTEDDMILADTDVTYCYFPIDVIHAIESNQKSEEEKSNSDDNEEEVQSREEDETKELVADTITNNSTPIATTSVIYEATNTDASSEEVVEDDVVSETNEEYTYYANYQLTAYCATGNACADGVYPSVGYTVASNDPNLWHKWIYIDGWGTYYVHDKGAMPSNVIDIFMGSYDECIQFGRRSADIYVYN